MKKIGKASKVSVVITLMVMLLDQSGQAFARGGDMHGGGGPRGDAPHDFYYSPHYAPQGREFPVLPRGYMRFLMGGLEYFYWEGMFYRMVNSRYIVVPAPVGAVVSVIPQGVEPVIVDGTAYYNINGVTYTYTSNGYRVVQQPKTVIIKNYTNVQADPAVNQPASAVNVPVQNVPAAVPASSKDPNGLFTVNIPNVKEGYTPVTLKRSGSGFVGPQGEYYSEFPKVEQLKVMYAK